MRSKKLDRENNEKTRGKKQTSSEFIHYRYHTTTMATVSDEEILSRLQEPLVVFSIVLMCLPATVYIIGYSLTIFFNSKARVVHNFPHQDIDDEDRYHAA